MGMSVERPEKRVLFALGGTLYVSEDVTFQRDARLKRSVWGSES